MQLISGAHHRLITRQMRVHACTRIIFALHLIPTSERATDCVSNTGDTLPMIWCRPPIIPSLSSFLRTCLSYLTSNAHAARPSSLASLAFSWRASDRRHLWPKVCEESFCKTIFLPALLSLSSSLFFLLLFFLFFPFPFVLFEFDLFHPPMGALPSPRGSRHLFEMF